MSDNRLRELERRYCRSCELEVYDMTIMSRAEVDAVMQTEGRVCGRLYRLRDDRLLTADCRVGLEPAVEAATPEPQGGYVLGGI